MKRHKGIYYIKSYDGMVMISMWGEMYLTYDDDDDDDSNVQGHDDVNRDDDDV